MRTEKNLNLDKPPEGHRVTTESTRDRSRRHRRSARRSAGDVSPDCSQCTYAGCQGPPANGQDAGASTINLKESAPATGSMLASGENCPFLRSFSLPAFASVNIASAESFRQQESSFDSRAVVELRIGVWDSSHQDIAPLADGDRTISKQGANR